MATYQSSYAYEQQQVAYARAQAEQRRRQQIRYEYGLATGINSSPTIREGLNLDRNWNTSLQNTLKHVCNPKTTKGQDDARKKKLTTSELQQLIKKANSGDMSAIATLSRSYDGKSGIGTDIRTKEEIAAGNRRVWQNTVDGFKKIPYIIGEFSSVNDTYRLTTGKDPETGEDASRLEAAGWLTADLASLGISKVAKGAKVASKGLKALDKVNDASKATKAVDKASGNLLPMTLDNLQMFAKRSDEVISGAEKTRSNFMDDLKLGEYRPDRKLPRDKNGVPVPDVDRPHTQIATKKGRRETYTQAREWIYDSDNNLVVNRDIDFTDHGRPHNHHNPHQHNYVENVTGGTRQRLGESELKMP